MEGVGGFEIVCPEGQMELLLPDVIGIPMILEPGQFQFEGSGVIAHIYDDEGTVLCGIASLLREAQRFFVELQGFSRSRTL